MSKPLICHVVAGYPDERTCLELMKGMDEAGVSAIEVQIPFSDPIADGETIMRANDVALEGGMTTADSFDLMKRARKQGVNCDIYIMSYVQKARHFGLEAFCDEARKCDAKGLIIPDLPYDSPEYPQLLKLARARELELVPVLSPGMPDTRLQTLLSAKPNSVYVTSRRGITGNTYSGTRELERIIGSIRSESKAIVMVGFGISTPEDVTDALKFGDQAVVGSAIIKNFQADGLPKTLEYIGSLAEAAT
jgi:tryptophan synthase alpha subunit